jgi:aconitate hydratase 2/2-methylisocitrate dehydratase
MLKSYLSDEEKRIEQGLPALALTAEQTAELVELLKKDEIDQSEKLIDIFINKVPAGVDPAAYIKAAFLNDIATKKNYESLYQCKVRYRIIIYHAWWL